MKTVIRSREDHHGVEARGNRHFCAQTGLRFTSQKQLATTVLLPILIKIDQKIEPAVQLQATVPVEIRVHLEKPLIDR